MKLKQTHTRVLDENETHNDALTFFVQKKNLAKDVRFINDFCNMKFIRSGVMLLVDAIKIIIETSSFAMKGARRRDII